MLASVLGSACVVSQTIAPYSSSGTEVLTIQSTVLGESRQIYIHTPVPDAPGPDARYPVLYLMDAESHFDMLRQYTDYLSRWDVAVMPKIMVVGIVNTKRTRDLTPTESIIDYFGKPDTAVVSWMKPSGGNAQFLRFIQQELMPYVNNHYKTAPFSIFAGHSFGGLAAINCLFTHPDMFNAYIAVSPSFWWDDGYVLKLADKQLKNLPVLNKQIFYSDASEGTRDTSSYHTNVLKFDSLLQNKKLKGLACRYKYYPEESHMTAPLVAYYDALRFIFEGWKPLPKK
jgi:predicted alpha/beta superfamily hydrolase